MRRTRFVPLFVLAAAAAAQNFTVSPLGYDLVNGGGGNTFPWSFSTGRYQQIHGDMRGTVRVITALSLRRYGVATIYLSATARTVDIELLLGESNHATASATFANNYVTPPRLVVNRKMVNLPDFTQPQGTPAPWNLVIPFDAPHVQLPANDLLWEYVLYGSTATGTYFCDHKASTLTANASHVLTGTGCVATGRTVPMLISAAQSGSATTQLLQVIWNCANAPAGAASSILVGLGNPNVPIPGLCANLYVYQLFLTINATATATGTFTSNTLSFPLNPALAGLQTHAQGASVDAGPPNTPFALTNGVMTTWAVPDFVRIARIWLSGSPTGTSGSLGAYDALVTRFTH